MKKIVTLLLCLLFIAGTNAQYVTVPDANFRSFLKNLYPGCFNVSGLMDTSCTEVLAETSIVCDTLNISNLSGIQYFKSLQYLECIDNQLISLPALPLSLGYLICSANKLTSLPALPDGLVVLNCGSNQITSLPAIPNSVQDLDCDNNLISNLILPSPLTSLMSRLNCSDNKLTSLPALPPLLGYLSCANNKLVNLPKLPNGLFFLICATDQLTSLPLLPAALGYLDCSGNQLTTMPSLPASLWGLYCDSNKLANLPSLPNSLAELGCGKNSSLLCLPQLPGGLQQLLLYSGDAIKCLPNKVNGLIVYNYKNIYDASLTAINFPVCSGNYDPNNCTTYPYNILACGLLGITTITSDLTGNKYQWQIDTCTNNKCFVNLINNINYSGVTTQTLHLINLSLLQSKALYRCVVDTNITTEYAFQFLDTWTGLVNTTWENAANWSCGKIPDSNLNVVINSGLSNYPVINSAVSIKSLYINPTASVNVNRGFKLNIVGNKYFSLPQQVSISEVNPETTSTGQTITIYGNNFSSDATVTVGGITATNINVINAGTITATIPTGILIGTTIVSVSCATGTATFYIVID